MTCLMTAFTLTSASMAVVLPSVFALAHEHTMLACATMRLLPYMLYQLAKHMYDMLQLTVAKMTYTAGSALPVQLDPCCHDSMLSSCPKCHCSAACSCHLYCDSPAQANLPVDQQPSLHVRQDTSLCLYVLHSWQEVTHGYADSNSTWHLTNEPQPALEMCLSMSLLSC